ncbi:MULTISPECIES: histidine ammonia-lyase [unclassified Streptomyces]|uniref:HAL/PAL/TAL family ammonia-lyase n=1 Tax=unclassified Streptomyces TaxID=2593676 RepID=UPI00278C629E|nr:MULTISPECIES: aromatic amino acid ammonia-lyase [unclassified Streptomyces]
MQDNWSGPVDDVVRVDGHSLSLAQVAETARTPQRRAVVLCAEAERRMRRSVDVKERLVDAGVPLYGVTAGFGDSNTRQISGAKAAALQTNLVRFLSCGVGPHAADEVVRATMLIRANCLARGHSALRPHVVRLLLDCLNAGLLPLVPERGSVGASGDLIPLSYLANLLTGQGEVRCAGEVVPSATALERAGLEPVELVAKEGLALLNGTSFMSAFAALAVHDARRLAFASEVCTALTSRVTVGNPGHFAPFVFAHKPHPGTARSAAVVRTLLGSAAAEPRAAEPEAAGQDGGPGVPEAGYRQLDRPIQDRYSIRCAPHVTGVLRDTLSWVEPWIGTEVNSTNDNPLFDADTGRVHNGGNFYGGHVGQAMDALRTAVAGVADLLDRQLQLVVDEKFNNGLTPNLIPRFPEDSREAGLHHGFKGMQLAASALAAEALHLTMPATSFSRSTEAHNQDKVSMGTIAARHTRTAVDLTLRLTAIHLLALCQAADLRGTDVLSPELRRVHALVRKVSPFVEGDRALEHDITAVADLVRGGALDLEDEPAG